MHNHPLVSSESPRQANREHSDTSPETPSWTNVKPQLSPKQGESLFLSQSAISILRTLVKDWIDFNLILVFYLCCGSIGRIAIVLDTLFETQLFESFIRLVEAFDADAEASRASVRNQL